MTVEDLRQFLSDLPPKMPVLFYGQSGSARNASPRSVGISYVRMDAKKNGNTAYPHELASREEAASESLNLCLVIRGK